VGGLRQRVHGFSTRVHGPSPATTWLSWLGDERLAIGNLPTGETLPRLTGQGVTHVVNCRARLQTVVSQDLAAERALLGPGRVAHAPMWDSGLPQPPRLWSAAAVFAARALDDPRARVLVHCQQGRRRSVFVAYAILRLRGHSESGAAALISRHRREAELVAAYTGGVERWLADGGTPLGPLRLR
jgi:atypical dual specificity phosphatase